MKAVVCEQPGTLSLVTRSPPVRQTDEVLVRIRCVGLCGTDYHIYEGNQPYLAYPRVMGHELAGEVVEAPAGSALRSGQTITINPYLPCGTCRACHRGRPNCCCNIQVLGVHRDGGMVELLSVPEDAVIDATGLTLEQAAMVEFLSIGAHAVARSGARKGDRVLVAGAGPIGIATALFARMNGATVTLTDLRDARLAYAASRLGFTDTVRGGEGAAELLRARSDGEMFDIVFDATGHIGAMSSNLSYVAHSGTFVLVGVAKGDLVYADPEFHKRETTLLASRNALRADFDRVIAAIRSGDIPDAALYTHGFDAVDMPTRLPRLIAEADHVLKAIARF
ncbi:dehydrogenase [Niveispirillum cyanobacteriorum]|uniref:Dehydrogenase n=2 Tax=Niveispirillum cyanobacteriorum TaxID=1612173 RepID=A0A2K9NIK5_9PROT|nr:dehydrogenase [Niveispirillum cyanobacteriorum]GGE77252.1 alcohol dehydrogenase [Niveispirillum cyanobacteriorum]